MTRSPDSTPFPRLSGILLHPISLPSRGGIGDFGPAAYEFLDFLAAAHQGLWQVLPLNPPANGNSLEFRLSLDQTYLPPLMAQLRAVLEQFPVVGRQGS